MARAVRPSQPYLTQLQPRQLDSITKSACLRCFRIYVDGSTRLDSELAKLIRLSHVAIVAPCPFNTVAVTACGDV